jgi:hypothetical protein
MLKHLAAISGIIILIVLCIYYPFLPGQYDPVALPLSTVAQLLSLFILLLVPIGLAWLIYELWQRSRRKRGLSTKGGAFYFALAALVVGSILVLLLSLLAFMAFSRVLGLLTLSLWSYGLSKWRPTMRRMKIGAAEPINPAPLYLILIPLLVLIAGLFLTAPATEFSRNRAIANSARLIDEIDRHHAEFGQYPDSLLAVWQDYHPFVVGIEKYHYEPKGAAYSVFFEQPAVLFSNFGTREFVMYNKLDEHVMSSHASWRLFWPPQQLAANQGWYEVHDVPSPHWKYFWFD